MLLHVNVASFECVNMSKMSTLYYYFFTYLILLIQWAYQEKQQVG